MKSFLRIKKDTSFPLLIVTVLTIVSFLHFLDIGVSLAGLNEWTAHGPNGARTFGIAIHPQDRNIVYAACIDLGVFRSTDSGENWEHISLNHIHPLDIDICPQDPSVLLAADWLGVVMSRDGGQNWRYVWKGLSGSGDYTYFIEISPHNSNNMVAGGSVNICISKDGGNTWKSSEYFWYIGTKSAEFDPLDSQVIYVGTDNRRSIDNGGLFKSVDGGSTWERISAGTPGLLTVFDIAIDPSCTDTIFFGGSSYDFGTPDYTGQCSLYRSLDGGNSWECIGLEMESKFVRKIIIDSSKSPRHIYVATFDKGVWKSTDGGDNWFPINNGLKDLETLTIVYDMYTQILYLGTYYGGIYRSFDGGENWEEISKNVYGSRVERMAINPLNSNTIYVSAYNGFYKTTDRANTWVNLSPNIPTTCKVRAVGIDPIDTNIVYAGAYGDGLYKSIDGGATWERKSNGLPDSAMVETIVGCSDRFIYRVYASLWSEGVFLSEDGVETWHSRRDWLPEDKSTQRLVIDPVDPDIMYIGTLDGIYKTLDGGMKWERKSRGLDNQSYTFSPYIDPSNHERVYVLTDIDVYTSDEGGRQWDRLFMKIPTSYPYPQPTSMIIDPRDSSHLLLGVSPVGVYESFDQGKSWKAMNQGFLGYPIIWNFETDPLDPNTYFAGTFSCSFCMYTRSTVGVEDIDSEIVSADYSLLQNYPNPFNQSTSINFQIPMTKFRSSTHTALKVYNILGHEVATLLDEPKEPGYYTVQWDGKDTFGNAVASGVYFCRLTTDSFNTTKRMVLLR